MTNYLEMGFMPDEGCGQRLEPLEYDYEFKCSFPSPEVAILSLSEALMVLKGLAVRFVVVERCLFEDKSLDLKVHFGDHFLRSERLQFKPRTRDVVSLMSTALTLHGGSASVTETNFEGLIKELGSELTPGAKVLGRSLCIMAVDGKLERLCKGETAVEVGLEHGQELVGPLDGIGYSGGLVKVRIAGNEIAYFKDSSQGKVLEESLGGLPRGTQVHVRCMNSAGIPKLHVWVEDGRDREG